MSLLTLMAVMAAVMHGGLQANDDLVLRRAEPPPLGEIVSLDEQGAVVRSATRGPVLVPWWRVLSVKGEWADEALPFTEVADLSWRADIRRARGDTVTAEPMYERLLSLLGESNGPVRVRALEGLLRCQLERGAVSLSLMTWTAWIDAAEFAPVAPVYIRRGSQEERLTSPATVLLPELPPIWEDGEEARFFALQSRDSSRLTKGQILEALYRAAARTAAGLPAEMAEVASVDPDVLFVRDIVHAQSVDRELSRSARDRLLSRLEEQTSGWQEAWIRVAVGRSLLQEDELIDRDRGLVQLMHVPARSVIVAPDLVGVALRDVLAEAQKRNDLEMQQVISEELRRLESVLYTRLESQP
jgi:hypothetical protein